MLLSQCILSPLVLSLVLKRINNFDDLEQFDKEIYNSVNKVWDLEGDDVVDALGLTFSVEVARNIQKDHDLIPNGHKLKVNSRNKTHYCLLLANWYINGMIKENVASIKRGLLAFFPEKWMSLFDAKELQLIFHGSDAPLDISDWKQNTTYGPPFSEDHPTIELFWQILEEETDKFRRDLLFFATAASQPPLVGFGGLSPLFCLVGTGKDDLNELPSASTCANLLKMPPYNSIQIMKAKIELALQQHGGFNLT